MTDRGNIVITGPTASGKTALAVAACRRIGGEIISADSRQVYRGMDIGTGKDLSEYTEGGTPVNYHLIDICDPGDKYHVHAFQEDAFNAVQVIRENGHIPVFCGGTGLYLEAIMESHAFTAVPVDEVLRGSLERLDTPELIQRYKNGIPLPFQVDLSSRKRLIRGIEMQKYLARHTSPPASGISGAFTTFLIDLPREERRRRITERLSRRLEEGLVEEVETLLKVHPPEALIYYGLEYKYLTEYLTGKRTFREMHEKLETEIHRYAKRQMTWFRRMERNGISMHSIDGTQPLDLQLSRLLEIIH